MDNNTTIKYFIIKSKVNPFKSFNKGKFKKNMTELTQNAFLKNNNKIIKDCKK